MSRTTSNRNKVVGWAVGGIAVLGLIANGVVGGGFRLPEFNSAGAPSPTATYPAFEPFNAFITATGSTSNTLRYAATCIPNPLVGLTPNLGSGGLLVLSYQGGNNPAGIGGDIYFTKDCNDKTTTGSTVIINDFPTNTGGTVTWFASTGGEKLWNGAEYIKVVFRGNPTSSYTGRLRGFYMDIYGE